MNENEIQIDEHNAHSTESLAARVQNLRIGTARIAERLRALDAERAAMGATDPTDM